MKATNWLKLGIYCSQKFRLRDGFAIVGILPDAPHLFQTYHVSTLANPDPKPETTELQLVEFDCESVYVGYAETSNTIIVQEAFCP